jgi:hypothetical protein
MKIKREKLISMWGLVNRLTNEKTSVKFHYLMLKNKRLIEPEMQSLQSAQQPPDEFKEFEAKRMAACNEACEKKDGKPKIENGNFVILEEKRAEFDATLQKLKDEYKEVLEKITDNQKQFADLIEEEIEIDLLKIPMSIVPQSMLGADVDLLFDLIDEDK